MIEQISNENLRVSIDLHGGTLTSFYDIKHDKELLWQGDIASWTGQDVVIFPLVGRCKEGYYTVENKKYEMLIHGLCDYSDFDVRERSTDSIVIGIHSSVETLQQYPYKFDFEVCRKLVDNTLVTTLKVVNLDDKEMYFGLGAHPALALPYEEKEDGSIDTSMNYLDFKKVYKPNTYTLFEGRFVEGKESFGEVEKLPLSKELMDKYPTVMLCDDFPKEFDLVKADGRKISFDINGAKVLGLWTWEKIGAYYCIEPWLGLPDFENVERELKNKELINKLDKKASFEFTFKMTAK